MTFSVVTETSGSRWFGKRRRSNGSFCGICISTGDLPFSWPPLLGTINNLPWNAEGGREVAWQNRCLRGRYVLGLKMLSLGVLFLRKISEYVDCKKSKPSQFHEGSFVWDGERAICSYGGYILDLAKLYRHRLGLCLWSASVGPGDHDDILSQQAWGEWRCCLGEEREGKGSRSVFLLWCGQTKCDSARNSKPQPVLIPNLSLCHCAGQRRAAKAPSSYHQIQTEPDIRVPAWEISCPDLVEQEVGWMAEWRAATKLPNYPLREALSPCLSMPLAGFYSRILQMQ